MAHQLRSQSLLVAPKNTLKHRFNLFITEYPDAFPLWLLGNDYVFQSDNLYRSGNHHAGLYYRLHEFEILRLDSTQGLPG